MFVGRSVGGAERPNALGTLIGAMMVSTLENGLTICAVPFYVLPAVKGAVLALALVAAYATKVQTVNSLPLKKNKQETSAARTFLLLLKNISIALSQSSYVRDGSLRGTTLLFMEREYLLYFT